MEGEGEGGEGKQLGDSGTHQIDQLGMICNYIC